MPFDATTPVRLGLNDLLAYYGIQPVSMELLARHKVEQVRVARASFLATWKPWAIGGSLALTAGVLLGCAILLPILGLTVISVIFARVLYQPVMGKPMVRQGRWVEYRDVAHYVAPPPIARIALDLMDRHPEGVLILGKLVQNEVVLDPYLLFKLNDEQVCLGIWDGGVIAAAYYI